ncbi:uncharacterized protein [Apostichopus japonicus]|uniref:uncharacterized protein n=1 Tax=Stichopus japonicus TaxID=307972 RepID=UPI003AB677E3
MTKTIIITIVVGLIFRADTLKCYNSYQIGCRDADNQYALTCAGMEHNNRDPIETVCAAGEECVKMTALYSYKDMFMVDLGKAECKQVTIQDCVDRDMLPKEFEVELRPLDAFIEAFDLTEEKLEVCTCSDKDLCNRAFNTTGGFLAIILTSLVAFNGFILG